MPLLRTHVLHRNTGQWQQDRKRGQLGPATLTSTRQHDRYSRRGLIEPVDLMYACTSTAALEDNAWFGPFPKLDASDL